MDGNFTCNFRYAIGLLNVEKVIKACPSLESISITIPCRNGHWDRFPQFTIRLKGLLKPLPRLQHLTLCGYAESTRIPGEFLIEVIKELPSLVSLDISRFNFSETSTVEESFGWNLSRHQNIRKLSLRDLTLKDQTWDLNCWVEQLTTLELRCCRPINLRTLHRLLSGSAPSLTKLCIQFEGIDDGYPPADFTEQFILPALKELIMPDHCNANPLANFEDCKKLEVLECGHILDDELCKTMKHHLSLATWPKISTLRLCHSSWYNSVTQARAKREVEHIQKISSIDVFISKNPYRCGQNRFSVVQ
ncbi:uncharacterized protein MELLADRAFT_112768 [Melampsora larici-populina 98AG31]|uniref:F-box domain-containing protein n=1 Tax=Melampsora larici-populina (strain 98AG31 / pathotype 3-4-7) TaxID=747676 RepID=F4S7J0_MELLP|nr:uncharacterized protein MELLADRAFT_112768 [Melampsora larici-populina 98AG31]EGF99416.1 hypothetical protein MELLADRAFT_112768 [Melampsora larici-populina 98AG31]